MLVVRDLPASTRDDLATLVDRFHCWRGSKLAIKKCLRESGVAKTDIEQYVALVESVRDIH